mmetsp:Transcript_12130/g.36978  ORF Transcript_12130/g.36978 Transcript_12130/m.36978 type:complete len:860 (+) Transcript_12130:144-2723(+)
MAAPERVEKDPTGRYVRTNKLLGKGAYKDVYKGYDLSEGLEVAWNKLQADRLTDLELEKVSREVEFLDAVNHKNIIKFYTKWETEDSNGRKKMDFITELMTSGTLKEFIKNAQSISLKVIRRWSLNILEAISYLHSFDPPIMHRDLKCDNVFINGHVGEVKLGDLGLSSVKTREKAYTMIGTPEFMAPELYDEEYTEKVDVYAFGMCMLEMLTMEYPYKECHTTAQIIRKVVNGDRPVSLEKVVDSQFKDVILKCLQKEARRPSAAELLEHPLFRDWQSDDGRLSNVDLVSASGHQVERAPANNVNNGGIRDAVVHHSPNLERDMLICNNQEQLPSRPMTDTGAIRIGLQVPVGNTLKNISFMFDTTVDSPEEIAGEILDEFNLNKTYFEQIRRDVETQVKASSTTISQVSSPMKVDTGMIERRAQQDNIFDDFGVTRVHRGDADEIVNSNSVTDLQEDAPTRGSSVTRLSASSRGRSDFGSRMNLNGAADSLQLHNSKIFATCMELMAHCSKGRLESARAKLRQGASTNFSDYDKRTPLHLAATEGHADVVELLLQHDANPEMKDRWGSTAMDDAVRNKRENVIKIFEKYGVRRDDADPMTSGGLAEMELLEFSARGLYDLVRQRLMAGVSAQYADYDKRTPLHLAASEGHADVAELLLVNGARMDVRDRFGRTPIDDAIKNGSKAVLQVMKQYDGDVPAKLLDASRTMERFRGMDLIDHAAKGRLNKVKECVRSGVNINFSDYDHRCALHLAAAEGQLEVVKYLLEKGALLNVKDRWGVTPLDEADKKMHRDVCDVLEAAGGTNGNLLGGLSSPSHSVQSANGFSDTDMRQSSLVPSIVNIETLKTMSISTMNNQGH